MEVPSYFLLFSLNPSLIKTLNKNLNPKNGKKEPAVQRSASIFFRVSGTHRDRTNSPQRERGIFTRRKKKKKKDDADDGFEEEPVDDKIVVFFFLKAFAIERGGTSQRRISFINRRERERQYSHRPKTRLARDASGWKRR